VTPVNPLRTFGFVLKDVSRRYVERFEQRASVLGLTLPQCKVLVYLASHEGLSQVQLATLTDLEPMALVRALDSLETQGCLERRNDPTDRRARRLYLLPKGKPLVDDIWQLVDLTRQEAFSGIPTHQVDLMIESLEKIQHNLVALAPLPASAPTALPIRQHRSASRE
jgi:MarR family transcriptional regulator for hemolysin